MKIKTIKLFLLIAVGLFLVSGVFFCGENAFAKSASYENYENIPGQKKTDSLVTYIENVYKFGIAIVAILALFMIVLGSFNYIVTSAGNASKMGDAKDMIVKAVEGLVLALAAYLILFIINPDLIGSTIGGTESVGTKEDVYKGTECKGDSKYSGYKEACTEEKCQDETEVVKKIDFTKADNNNNFNNDCNNNKEYNRWFKHYSKSTVDECVLKVIAHMESGCGSNSARGGGKNGEELECGMMQMKPSVARKYKEVLKTKTDERVCELLEGNENGLAIYLAAKYIDDNEPATIADTFAGYNGGFGTRLSEEKKKPPLASSSDCGGGAKAYECCVNPGGLDISINYVWNGISLYKKCEKDWKNKSLQ
jgi:Type IV secretion system pilin/Transglycosylase SLT domain